MNDYKELIERLNRSGLSNGATLGHHSALYDEAADAIEQLVKERNAAVADLKFLCKNYNVLNICITCGHCADRGVGCNKETCEYEWRGAQNADS